MSEVEAETAFASPNRKRDDSGSSSDGRVTNNYFSKKILAQGMFDIALLSSNANQLVHLLTAPEDAADPQAKLPTAAIVFLIISIVLQVLVGICLVLVTLMESRLRSHREWKRHINDISTVLVFIITVISVIIPSLSAGFSNPHFRNETITICGPALSPPAARS